jgi:hypothetical protein
VLFKNLAKTTLGIKNHYVIRVIQGRSDLHVYLDRIRGQRLICSRCNTRHQVQDRLKEQTWQHVPLWNIPVFLYYQPSRVQGRRCGTAVERIPRGNAKSRLTFPYDFGNGLVVQANAYGSGGQDVQGLWELGVFGVQTSRGLRFNMQG